MWSIARSSEEPMPDMPVGVEVRIVARARRLRMRLDPSQNVLKVTVPPRTSRRRIAAFLSENRDWIDEQVATRPPAEPFADGAIVPLEGVDHEIRWVPTDSRRIVVGDRQIRCGGPDSGLARRVEQFFRARARSVLEAETRALCERHGLQVSAVTVGDASTRWGSCSSRGRIRYNWRIIMAPPEVREYLVAHEVAHLVHLDHGPQFRETEERLYGRPVAPARALLRTIGPRLHRLGRS